MEVYFQDNRPTSSQQSRHKQYINGGCNNIFHPVLDVHAVGQSRAVTSMYRSRRKTAGVSPQGVTGRTLSYAMKTACPRLTGDIISRFSSAQQFRSVARHSRDNVVLLSQMFVYVLLISAGCTLNTYIRAPPN